MAEASLAVLITGSGQKLIDEFKKVGNAASDSGNKTSSGWSKASKGIQVAGLAIAGVALAIGAKSIDMADNYESAHAKMVTALKNTGSSWAAMGKQVDVASQSAVKFGYTKTDVESALAQMTTGMGSSKKALGELTLAENIAAARGIDLSSAAMLVTKASEGQLRPLKQAGIDLPIVAGGALKTKTAYEAWGKSQDKLKTLMEQYHAGLMKGPAYLKAYATDTAGVQAAQQKFNDVSQSGTNILQALAQKFGGSAAAQADTFGGKVKAMKAALSNVEIEIGMKLIPVLTRMLGWLSNGVIWLTKHKAAAIALGVVLGGVLLAAIVAWTASMIAAAAATIAAAAPILAIIAVIALLVGAVVFMWTHWNQIWNWVMSHKAYAIIIALISPIIGIIFLVIAAAKALQDHWSTIWAGIQSVAETAGRIIMGVIQPIIDGIHLIQGAWSFVSGVASGPVNRPQGLSTNPQTRYGSIAKHAAGGIFTTPHVGMVAENGPEAIIPLSRGGGLGTTQIVVNINGPIMGADVEQTVHKAMKNLTRKNGSIVGVSVSH